MKKCVFVVGPTASGKSSLGLALAEKFGGVIISADSMQIYREMNIGTAKPSAEDQKRVPHRLVDIRSVSEEFSVYDFKALALKEIKNAHDEGKISFIVGGTGLYVDALIHNTDFGEMEIDPQVRKRLESEIQAGKNAALLARLSEIDPETAAELHEKDAKRIVRALEVYESTGKTLTAFKAESRKKKPEFEFIILYLVYADRQKLYDRINQRVDQMLRNGLLQETKMLWEQHAFSYKTASQAIGYKELLPVITENADLGEAVALLKQRTRNYAKRQITWFNRYQSIPILMDGEDSPLLAAEKAVAAFQKDI